VLGTRVAETILASGHMRPHKQAAHMIASDPIKPLLSHLARRRPSTYAFSYKCTIGNCIFAWKMTPVGSSFKVRFAPILLKNSSVVRE